MLTWTWKEHGPPITIVIEETNFSDDGKERHTVYKVVVQTKKAQFIVDRRYNDFYDLHRKLKVGFPREEIPPLPGKRFFGNNFDPAFIETRRQALEEYLQGLLGNYMWLGSSALTSFLYNDALVTPNRPPDAAQLIAQREANESNQKRQSDQNYVDLSGTERQHTSLDDFALLKVIGKGNFGRVVLARHRVSEKVYAIKIVLKESVKKRNEARHVMVERNVLVQNIKHPFLVGLHYSFQTADKLFFVLDYVNGGELFFHLQREQRFSEARARLYAAEIVSALAFMHDNDIVYRDLKPENVLLSTSGHIVLTDFGLCKDALKPGETTGTFCGTPEYLAPEVLRKQPYGRPVDWWCFGAVLYEMLVGLPPFFHRDHRQMYHRILYDRLRFPSHVSPRARSLLTQLLERDPKRRLGSGERGALEIKSHSFFDQIDWASLDRKEYQPPFIPSVVGSLDLKNIDPRFVNEPVADMLEREAMQATFDLDTFVGFTYTVDPSRLSLFAQDDVS